MLPKYLTKRLGLTFYKPAKYLFESDFADTVSALTLIFKSWKLAGRSNSCKYKINNHPYVSYFYFSSLFILYTTNNQFQGIFFFCVLYHFLKFNVQKFLSKLLSKQSKQNKQTSQLSIFSCPRTMTRKERLDGTKESASFEIAALFTRLYKVRRKAR